MFDFLKRKTKAELESAEVQRYRKDNETLLAKVSQLEGKLKRSEDQVQIYKKDSDSRQDKLNDAIDEIESLKAKIKKLQSDSSKKVTYASARKTMSKAKLKEMKAALEAVPSGANGFAGTVSVYDKKSKRLETVTLTSKDQALDLVKKAEKGNVDIVM